MEQKFEKLKNDKKRVEALLELTGLAFDTSKDGKILCDIVRMKFLTNSKREEICSAIYEKYGCYISLGTYHNKLNKALNLFSEFI